jgi:AraC-like DNA-binding protein/mannose-6-phosphate isomerase-like protein (cupin superfamily)
MKAGFQKLSAESPGSSFTSFWVKSNAFGFHWHYHPELEICFVKKGRGKRIIGETIEDFGHGDLVLVGKNLPHSWVSDEPFNQSAEQMEVFVVQFREDVLGQVLQLPEAGSLVQLMARSHQGVVFSSTPKLESLLEVLNSTFGMQRWLCLIELLQLLASSPYATLNQGGYKADLHRYQEERIIKVCDHIHNHYRSPIRIGTLAELVSMNEAAFCRFFKKTLGKTVSEYIRELRISHVCQQIQNTKDPLYKIAYDSGFSSLTLFNRQFKRVTGRTPGQYRRFGL